MDDVRDGLPAKDVPSMIPVNVDDRLSLVEVMREVRQRYGASVEYNRLWRYVAQGEVPAERAGSRWLVRRSDVPRVAAAFGISAAA